MRLELLYISSDLSGNRCLLFLLLYYRLFSNVLWLCILSLCGSFKILNAGMTFDALYLSAQVFIF